MKKINHMKQLKIIKTQQTTILYKQNEYEYGI
jgi:hypothetical protein